MNYFKLILNVTTEEYSTNYHVNFDKMKPAIYICRDNKREIIQDTPRIHKTGKKHKRSPTRSNVNEQIASFVLSIRSRLVCAVAISHRRAFECDRECGVTADALCASKYGYYYLLIDSLDVPAHACLLLIKRFLSVKLILATHDPCAWDRYLVPIPILNRRVYHHYCLFVGEPESRACAQAPSNTT